MMDGGSRLAKDLMLQLDQFMNIRCLHKQGHSVRQIARLTGHSRNTVRKLLRATRAPSPVPRARSSKLDPFKAYLTQRWEEYGLSAVRLLPEIQAQGFSGSAQIVRRFLHDLKAARQPDPTLTVRFETPPGEQAQCDWAEIGRYPQPDGSHARVYAFVMILGYSRFLHVEFTRSMSLPTLIRCHQNAFGFFGGWPRRILYDNMRQVVVGPERVNARFLDFTRHHGFEVRRCRPYRPRTKGKVERSVAYLRDNFLNGRSFTGLDDLNAQARHWLGSVANVRLHGTTHARPCDRLLEETLTPCTGLNAYQVTHCTSRTVSAEALVRFDRSDYSVPTRWTGTRVSVDAGESVLLIRAKDLIIAEHPLAAAPGQRIESPVHVRERWERSVPARLAPPPKGCHITFTESVEARPLSHYVEVAS
ncbi:MAG: IS21 family transposase [Verrucomicrobiales bacterium]|nr:IS21 family transposase [Verrucomicrobiales bacterium]